MYVYVKSEGVALARVCTDALRGWAQGTQGVFPTYDANKCQRVRVARFILVQNNKMWKICTKWPQNLPSGHKTPNSLFVPTKWQYKIQTGHKLCVSKISNPRPKNNQNWDVWYAKICHLATLDGVEAANVIATFCIFLMKFVFWDWNVCSNKFYPNRFGLTFIKSTV
jgi:hypothetical protein